MKQAYTLIFPFNIHSHSIYIRINQCNFNLIKYEKYENYATLIHALTLHSLLQLNCCLSGYIFC